MANKIPRVPVREQDPQIRATNFEEVCYGYDLDEARLEASRCLHCRNPRCVAACPVSILAAGSDEVIPPDHAKRLRDCFSTPVNYQEFPGAMHNTIWLSPGFDKAFSRSISY